MKEKSAKKLENATKNAELPALTWRRSPVRIRPIPLIFDETAPLKASVEVLSVARIMAKNEHEEEKKLHNSSGADEIEPADSDLTQHAENDLNDAPEISITEPNGYYFTDADGHVKRRECLAEDLVPPNDFDANEWSKRAKKLN